MELHKRRMKNITRWKEILLEMIAYKLVFSKSSYPDVQRLRSYFDCGSLNEWIESEVEDMLDLAQSVIDLHY